MDQPIHITPNPWPDMRRQPLFSALIAMLLIGAIVWEVAAIAGKMKQYRTIGESPAAPRQIAVSGQGKVRAVPDVAVVTVGFTERDPDPRTVQSVVNQKIENLMTAVTGDASINLDVQTSEFSVYPQYAYEERKAPRVTGYEARQAVEIRIRDLGRINEVLGVVGDAGATNISGLHLTIDDPKELQAQARQKAIAAARLEAARIADALGVRLGDPVTFNESGGGPPVYAMRALTAEATGGGEFEPPVIQRGSNDVVVDVSITYAFE